MKRHLILLRHGAAKAHSTTGLDHDRPLKRRGAEQARDVGAWLAREQWAIDQVLVSGALRTRQTAEIVLGELQQVPESQAQDGLYLAEPATILNSVRGVEASCTRLLVVGHNPGLSQLAAELVHPQPVPDLSTGTLVAMHFDSEWSELRQATLDLWREPVLG